MRSGTAALPLLQLLSPECPSLHGCPEGGPGQQPPVVSTTHRHVLQGACILEGFLCIVTLCGTCLNAAVLPVHYLFITASNSLNQTNSMGSNGCIYMAFQSTSSSCCSQHAAKLITPQCVFLKLNHRLTRNISQISPLKMLKPELARS